MDSEAACARGGLFNLLWRKLVPLIRLFKSSAVYSEEKGRLWKEWMKLAKLWRRDFASTSVFLLKIKKTWDVSNGNCRRKIKDWFCWRSAESSAEQQAHRRRGEEFLSCILRAHTFRSSLTPRRKEAYVMNIYWPSEAGSGTTFCYHFCQREKVT